MALAELNLPELSSMFVGVPTETKPAERRVALTPAGAAELIRRGHQVLVQSGAGAGARFPDNEYERQGATIVPDVASVFDRADLVVKVKEPTPGEVSLLRPEHTLLAYLHLAADTRLTSGLIASGATCVAYETVEDAQGRLPLLAPMSEIAGRLAAQVGARMLEHPSGGPGVLVGGALGVPPARVMVLGAGVVGLYAALVAAGLGGDVFVYDSRLGPLRDLELRLRGIVTPCHASAFAIADRLPEVDLVIGAVLVRGSKAPVVLTRNQIPQLRPGAVVVDVAIDQGGCFETSRPTTHAEPSYEVDGVLHYCVTNMPGAVPVTATQALTSATLPYVLQIADEGVGPALRADAGLRKGLSVMAGQLTCEPVARTQALPFMPPDDALAPTIRRTAS